MNVYQGQLTLLLDGDPLIKACLLREYVQTAWLTGWVSRASQLFVKQEEFVDGVAQQLLVVQEFGDVMLEFGRHDVQETSDKLRLEGRS